MSRAAREATFAGSPRSGLKVVFGAKRRTRRRPALLYCGDDQDANDVAATLIHDVGFEPLDAGPLRIARYLERFSLATAQIAYERDEGPDIAFRIERFGK